MFQEIIQDTHSSNRNDSATADLSGPSLFNSLPDYLPHLWEGLQAGFLKQFNDQGQKRIGFLGLGSRVSDYYDKKQKKEDRKRQAQLNKAKKNAAHEDAAALIQGEHEEAQERPSPEALKIKHWGCTFTSEMFEKDNRPKGFKGFVARLFHVEAYYHYCTLLKDLEPLGLKNTPESFAQVKYKNKEARKEWWFNKSLIETFSENLWNKHMLPLFNKKASKEALVERFNKVDAHIKKELDNYNKDLSLAKQKSNTAIKKATAGMWKAIGYQLGFNIQRVTKLLSERFFPNSKRSSVQHEESSEIHTAFQPSNTAYNSPQDSNSLPNSLSNSPSDSPRSSEDEDTDEAQYELLQSHSSDTSGSTVSLADDGTTASSSPQDTVLAQAQNQTENTQTLIADKEKLTETTTKAKPQEQPQLAQTRTISVFTIAAQAEQQIDQSLVLHAVQASSLPQDDIYKEVSLKLKLLSWDARIELWSDPSVSQARLETIVKEHVKQVKTILKNFVLKHHSDKTENTSNFLIGDITQLVNEIKEKINTELQEVLELKDKRERNKITESIYQNTFESKRKGFIEKRQKAEQGKDDDLKEHTDFDVALKRMDERLEEIAKGIERCNEAIKVERQERIKEQQRVQKAQQEMQKKLEQSIAVQQKMQENLDERDIVQAKMKAELQAVNEKNEENEKLEQQMCIMLDKVMNLTARYASNNFQGVFMGSEQISQNKQPTATSLVFDTTVKEAQATATQQEASFA